MVTEFRHTDDTHTGPFTIEAEFMTPAEMKELLEELLLNYRQEHVASAYLEVRGAEALEQRQKSAATAWKTFRSLFAHQPRLTEEYLSEDRNEAFDEILNSLERWAYAGLTNRPGGADATDFSAIAGDARECKDLLDMLMADLPGDVSPAIWPFIKIVRYAFIELLLRISYAECTRVYLQSPVLRTGLVLADLPGMRSCDNITKLIITGLY